MTLFPGANLGPYEIVALLGKGGMGEVYRARDTRLNRVVAIKVLPAELSADPQRRQRLEQEARLVSSLSHPHICMLLDVGHQSGIDYLVMEHLEGEPLSARIAKGPIPLDQVLRYGSEIADALAKAHRSGIIHRDLKPANIMLTKSGAKLLDFGLARWSKLASDTQAALSKLPTETDRLTEPGTILGTWQYMAPEQLEGKDADARTDIFALGAVIFEMATGRPAFTGKSKASIIASILSSTPPPLSQLQKISPPALDHLVSKCLEKDPDQRWHSAQDVASEVKWAAETFSLSEQGPAQRKKALRERAVLMMAVAALVAALGLVVAYRRMGPEPAASVRLSLLPPGKTSFSFSGLTISPDGRRLAFVSTGNKEKQGLWVRSLDSQTAELLPDTQDAYDPFWSPDSRSIAFFTRDKLKRVYPSGGSPEILCSLQEGAKGAWSSAGVVLFSAGPYRPLQQINLGDCSTKPATRIDESQKEVVHTLSHFLPDGKHFLFAVMRLLPDKGVDVYVGSLANDERQLVIRNASTPSYVSPRYLVFAREGKLLAQSFNAEKFHVEGDPFPLAQESVSTLHFDGTALYSVSRNGELVYLPNVPVQFQLQWLDRSGKMLERLTESGLTRTVQISPDGKRVLVNRSDPETDNGDVWIYDTRSRAWSRFTFEPTPVPEARWSPDGSQIIYMSRREGIFRIERRSSDGSGSPEILLESQRWVGPRSLSPGGRNLIYASNDPQTGFDLWLLPLAGDRKPTPFLQTRFNEGNAAFSPDGKWVAYVSDRSGENEIYVRPFAGPGADRQISSGTVLCFGGGCAPSPRWRADGKEFFYISADWKLMSVPITFNPEFQAGSPRALFDLPQDSQFDVTSDGQRFLVNMPVQGRGPVPLNVVLNWAAEHKP